MKHRIRNKKHSISSRLIWLFLGMGVLFIVLVGGTMSHAFKHGFQETLHPHLVRYLDYIEADLGSPPELARAKKIAQRIPVNIHYISNKETWSTKGVAPDLKSISREHSIFENGKEYILAHQNRQEFFMTRHTGYTLAYSVPHPNQWHWRLFIPVSVLIVVLMLLHYSIRKLIRPLSTLKEGVERIGKGDLEHRVVIDRKDEFGELASSVNTMAEDIQQMLEAKRHLLLAISHELRSPITRAKVALEFMNEGKERSELERDLNDMEALIEELLETERLSDSHQVLDKTEIEITGLVNDLIKELFSDAAIELKSNLEDTRIKVDIIRMKLLLKNLISNALKHNNNDKKPLNIDLSKNESGVSISVQDHGGGIDAQHIPHLTEPFYRVDPARLRQTGGYGLGLYLCRVITEAHSGKLEITSEKGSGTRVRILLPFDGS